MEAVELELCGASNVVIERMGPVIKRNAGHEGSGAELVVVYVHCIE